MTPTEAEKPENKYKVMNNLYLKSKIAPVKPKFKLGDNIRLSKVKSVFAKGYLPNYTNEIFTINKVFDTNSVTHEVKDESGNIIEGKFYNE